MLRAKEKLGYGFGDLASNIVFQSVANFMLIFYTDVFGISAVAAGTILLLVRLGDAVTDPIMGMVADRTRTRFGRYRPYLLWMAVPFAVMAVFAFTTPPFSGTALFVYAFVTYALMMLAYTMVNIPYAALGGVMTEDPSERASLQSWRFAMAMLGAMLVVWAVPNLVGVLGQGDPQQGYTRAMTCMGLFAIACFVLCFLWTKENSPSVQDRKHDSVLADLKTLFRNDQWAIVAGISFFVLILFSARISVAPHFVKYVLGQDDAFLGRFLLWANVGALIGAVCTNYLARYVEKKHLMWCALLGSILSGVALLMTPDQYLNLILLEFVFAQYFQNIVVILMFSMVADTVDYGACKYGQRIMGLTYSGQLLAVKAGFGVGGALAGWLLGFWGYQANAPQTEETLAGIRHIFSTVPIGCALICIGLAAAYRLDNAKMAEIHEKIHDWRCRQ